MCVGRVCWGAAGQLIYPKGTRVVLDRLAVVPPKFEPLIDDMSCLPLVVAQPGSSLPREVDIAELKLAERVD